MANKMNKKLPGRVFLIVGLFMLLWAVLIIRLFYLQIIDNEKYEKNVIDNVERETSVNANRGIIYDCNMVQLASNETTWRIFISPRDIEDTTEATLIATRLSEILGVDFKEIYEKTQKVNRADETIKKDITEEEFDKVVAFIKEYELDRKINYEAYTKRYYPYGSLAANTIGFVGTDGGLIGLELEYDNELTGVAGKYITARDAQGNRMPYKYDSYIEAENGANLVTTIDTRIQSVLEEQLKQTYYDSLPTNRCCGIVMDVNTGGVLAIAVYPSFDLNDPYTLDPESTEKLNESKLAEGSDEYNKLYWELVYSLWKNKAVTELYEPGSTFKVVTTAMALNENVTTFEDEYYCSGALNVDGYDQPIACHKTSGHGLVTYRVGLQQSCNPTLMQVAFKIGKQTFYNYFKSFGYSERTGIDLPGEATSIYAEYSNFSNVSLAVYSFGQTFKVTPIQQIRGICAVANGGYLVTPHIVSKIVDDEGNVVKVFEEKNYRQVVSTEVCKEISEVLEEGVAGDGGAKNTYVAGYKIAAKTGTSQKRDITDEELVVGSTVAYVPADDPKVAVLIMVDEPRIGSYYGSVVAAPYVANTLSGILPTLGVEKTYSEEDSMLITTAITDYTKLIATDAKQTIEAKGLNCEIIGEGEYVEAQSPASGTIFQKENGTVYLYTDAGAEKETATVPDVVDISPYSALRQLSNEGFNVLISGNVGDGARVTAQSVEAGSELELGSVVKIDIRYFNGTE